MMYFIIPDSLFINVYYIGHFIYLIALMIISYLFIKSSKFLEFTEVASKQFYEKNDSLMGVFFKHFSGVFLVYAFFTLVLKSFNYHPKFSSFILERTFYSIIPIFQYLLAVMLLFSIVVIYGRLAVVMGEKKCESLKVFSVFFISFTTLFFSVIM